MVTTHEESFLRTDEKSQSEQAPAQFPTPKSAER
jgi:hypothetical protein